MSFFGTNPSTTTTQPSLFGATTQSSIFGGGTSTSTPSTGFGGFGAGTTGGLGTFGSTTTTGGLGTFGSSTTTASTGGFGGFGTTGTTTTSAPSLFGGFGTTTTTSASPFSFNTPTTSATTGFGGFGTGTGSTFGGGTSGFGGFGSGTSTFGTGLSTFGGGGSTLGAGTGGSLFAGTTNQQQQQQQQQQQAEANLANVAMAVSLPQIYGDERDAIIARWNQLQAYWGTGKGFFSQQGAVEFKPDNHFCRFKALGYHLIPKGSNEQGQVALVLNKKESEVATHQQQVMDTLHRIMGSKPTLSVCVEGIKPLPEDKTEVVIYVLERPTSGPAKRVSANDLFDFLNNNTNRTQIASQLNVESMVPKVGWTAEQLKEYLEKPPAGVDPLLWQQAKLDNPDPEKYIPVPMIGFKELQKRLRLQAEQTRLYQQRIDVIASDLASLQTQHSTMLSKLEDYKRKDLELGHRLLKVITKQEIYRKMGYAIQEEEETLKVQLEQLQAELNHPTQFKGRLNELMSQMRMQIQTASARTDPAYTVDSETQADLKMILKQQQEGLQHLIDIIKEDASDLELIEQGIAKSQAR